jgi:hypothetical protein
LPPAWQDVHIAGGGDVEWQNGLLLLNMGNPLTGVRYTNEFPTLNYEIAFDAMRVMGSDFFCGLTIPVEDTHCTLILGGWGGSLVGISSINSMDASENQTTKFIGFDKERWYRVRVRVTKGRLEGWLDEDKIVDVLTKDEEISMRPGEIEMCKPLGLAAYVTLGAFRELRWRLEAEAADPPPKRF